ncbi:MAG: OmpA family protein [Alphaproteobacteria bacterium]|nr:OmpA family protein [Alphaproteobacteria bacterium]
MRFILFIAVCFAALPASAQVEVNMDVLEGYTPPPMFDAPEPAASKAPLPSKKPHTPAKPQPAPVEPVEKEILQESALATPDAREILATLDPTAELPPEQPPAPPEPKREIVYAQPLPSGPGKVSVAFLPGETTLQAPIPRSTIDEITIALKSHPQARIQIFAYADSSATDTESQERRVSLERALTVRSYLAQNEISPAIMDIRPLGSHSEQSPLERVDIVLLIPKSD